MSDSLQHHGLWPARLLCPWDSPGKNTGVGCHFLPQGIFPTQRLNPHLLHWQVDSLPLSHQGSMKIGTIWEQSEGNANPDRAEGPEHKRSFCPERFHQFCRFWERLSCAQGLPELRAHPQAEEPDRPPSPFMKLAPRGQYPRRCWAGGKSTPTNTAPNYHTHFFWHC